jgi:hypothetical protein
VLTLTVHRPSDPRPNAIERAARTGAAVAAAPDGWQWPRWLDRQLRPAHPAHVAPGDAGLVENLTGRDWKTIGTLSAGPLALVDPRGLVTPVRGGWSLDWLVGIDDVWHRPAREGGVRQRLVGGAPVVETACRVAGGDAVHRAFGVTGSAGLGEVVIVEVENQTPAPFAIAFALRPADLLGAGCITSIVLDDTVVLADGRPVLAFERRPARWCGSDGTVESLAALPGSAIEEVPFAPIRCPRGLAQAAFILPVPHRTTVRVAVTIQAARRDRPTLTGTVPAAGAVARGWDAHAERAARLELPDRRLTDAYAAAVRSLLLAGANGEVRAPAGREERWSVADEARVVRAFASCGLPDEAAVSLRRRCDELELDGWLRREEPSLARNDAIFNAIATTWFLHRGAADIESVIGPAVKAAHWSERYRARHALGVSERVAWAAHASLRGLAAFLEGVGQIDAAQDAAAFAARFVLDLDGHRPAAPEADPADSGWRATTPAGIDSVATIERAARWARAGDQRALDAVAWLAEVGTATGRWPTSVLPRLGRGSGGSGDDVVVSATVVELVRNFVVRDEQSALALLPLVPASWLGQAVDVHDLPTRAGRCSFAVRWHGERPALLWEVDAHDDAPLTIAAPGLDPAWSSTDMKGEALLAPPPARLAQPGSSFA